MPTQVYLIGVDIGTQGVKAALFDQQGRTRSTAFRPSRLLRGAPGAVEEDPQRQLKSVCQCARACVADAGVAASDVAAIGLDGQMAGILGVGADGRPVTPYDSWLDTRCASQIELMRKKAGPRIIQKTGGPPSFNHGPKILWWQSEHPGTFERVAAFVQPSGYVAMSLCGLDGSRAFIDKSYLHFSGFADNQNGCWDKSLCRTFGVPLAKLPRIVEPHDVVGQVERAMARRCGLRAGTPVIAGCGDTAASFLACGATHAGVCVDVSGTASVFAATTGQFMADTHHQVLACGQSATPSLWHPYAYINGGGMNLEWFARELAGLGRDKSRDTLEKLGRRAEKITPHDDDPMFIPHLGGRNSPAQPALRGAWAGLSWSHSAGHMYRAMLEGVALEYCVYLRVLRDLNPASTIQEIRVTGGGERSALWNQIKADALGVDVVQLTRPDGAPMGAAMLAGYGVGLFSDLNETANRWVQTGNRFRPRATAANYYQRRLAQYERLIGQLHEWSVC
jgi:xylulokinase